MKQQLSPTTLTQRLELPDMLRGFAIFGILMVNMLWMNAPVGFSFSNLSMWEGPTDKAFEFVIRFLFEGKFYILFSFLFGYSFYLFLQKQTHEQPSVLKYYIWRLILLVLMGALHVLLLWPGDILLFYGLFGLLMVLFRHKRNRALIIWAIILLFIPVILMTLSVLMVNFALSVPETASAIEASLMEQQESVALIIDNALRIYPTGSFSEIIKMRLTEYQLLLPAVLFFYPNVLAMFLIGLIAARKGSLSNPFQNISLIKKWFFLGLLIGIPANLAYAYISINHSLNDINYLTTLAMFCSGFGSPFLTLSYISGIILLLNKGFMNSLKLWLMAVGRMALTNYLMHSIIAAFLFHSYGLGLYGQVSVWQGIILCIAIFVIQIRFSIVWLKYFKFGPLEWLWRSLTYLKWQPLKKH